MWVARQTVKVLQKLPFNSFGVGLTHKLLNYVGDGPIGTRSGFRIDFKKTGVYPTALRKSVIAGSYERAYFQMMSRIVNPGDWAIDVGAHEGYVTLLLSSRVGQRGAVFSVEPNPANVHFLSRNLNLNSAGNVQVISKASGSKKSKMPLYCSADKGAWGSLIPFSYRAEETPVDVEVETLDNLFGSLKRIDFLKVDTEGNELEVFLGAEQILIRHKPHLCFEVSTTFWAYLERSVDSLFGFLRGLGYELFVLKDGRLSEYRWLDQRVVNMFGVHTSRKAALRQEGILPMEGGSL